MALASWGFVVVAPSHPGDTAFDGFDVCDPVELRAATLVERVDDVAGSRRRPAGRADARLAFLPSARARARRHPRWSSGASTAIVAGRDDRRIRAVLSLAPDARPERIGTAPVGVPTMVMVGELDYYDPSQTSLDQAYAILGPPRYAVHMRRTGHFAFSDPCFCCRAARLRAGLADAGRSARARPALRGAVLPPPRRRREAVAGAAAARRGGCRRRAARGAAPSATGAVCAVRRSARSKTMSWIEKNASVKRSASDDRHAAAGEAGAAHRSGRGRAHPHPPRMRHVVPGRSRHACLVCRASLACRGMLVARTADATRSRPTPTRDEVLGRSPSSGTSPR